MFIFDLNKLKKKHQILKTKYFIKQMLKLHFVFGEKWNIRKRCHELVFAQALLKNKPKN